MGDEEKSESQKAEDNKEGQTGTFDRAYVEELRGEAKSYRLKLRDAEKRVEDLEAKMKELTDADKPEIQKLTEEKVRLENLVKEKDAALQNSALDTAIRLAALQANVHDASAVAALIDRSEISYEDGSVNGVDKALKKLLKDKPYLVKGETEEPPPTPGAGGQPMGSGNKKPTLTDQIYQALQSAKNA